MKTFPVFKDKVAVVTGAGSGIGRALAQQLAVSGANLALSDVNQSGLDETVASLAGGVKTTTTVFDVAVLYALFRPTPPETLFDHSDKVGHTLAFMILALSGRLALFMLPKAGFWLPMLLAAIVLEYLQGEIQPLRSFSVGDIYANLTGVLVALVVLEWFLRDVLRTLQLRKAA